MLYYTGHGEIGTGNWCFADGTISIQEILDMRPEGTYYPMIFTDACYSGHWENFCLEKDIAGFHYLAACTEYSKAVDTKGLYSLKFNEHNSSHQPRWEGEREIGGNIFSMKCKSW